MLISKLFTTEAILGTTSKFVLYPLSSSLVQMLYLEEDMPTEKYYTPLNSQRNWIKLKLFKHSYCQQRKCKCVCGTFSWHNMCVSVGLLTAAIEKKKMPNQQIHLTAYAPITFSILLMVEIS